MSKTCSKVTGVRVEVLGFLAKDPHSSHHPVSFLSASRYQLPGTYNTNTSSSSLSLGICLSLFLPQGLQLLHLIPVSLPLCSHIWLLGKNRKKTYTCSQNITWRFWMKNVHIKINTHRVHLYRDFKDKAIAMGCEDYEIRSAQAE